MINQSQDLGYHQASSTPLSAPQTPSPSLPPTLPPSPCHRTYHHATIPSSHHIVSNSFIPTTHASVQQQLQYTSSLFNNSTETIHDISLFSIKGNKRHILFTHQFYCSFTFSLKKLSLYSS